MTTAGHGPPAPARGRDRTARRAQGQRLRPAAVTDPARRRPGDPALPAAVHGRLPAGRDPRRRRHRGRGQRRPRPDADGRTGPLPHHRQAGAARHRRGPGRARRLPTASPLLALRARVTLLPETAACAAGTFLRPLFRLPVIAAVIVSVAALDFWIFTAHGLGPALQPAAQRPGGPAARGRPFRRLRAVPRVRARGRAAGTAARGPGASERASTWCGPRSSPTSPTPTGSAGPAGCAPTWAACTST